jgi:transcriptional regulator GlxA family with amidase domain
MTQRQGVSRQHLARRFRHAAGMSPKMFARITRFQALVRALLENDVSQWAGVSTSVGTTIRPT